MSRVVADAGTPSASLRTSTLLVLTETTNVPLQVTAEAPVFNPILFDRGDLLIEKLEQLDGTGI